jgi:carbamoyl-phosphate synthase large subunit
VSEFTRLRILVTGVDGDSGQGLVKALRMSRSPMEIHGCDASGRGIGATFVRSLHIVPPATAGAAYLERLDRICRKYRFDALVPSTPVEIDALRGEPLPSGVPVISLSPSYRETYDDKLWCYRALEGAVPLAPFADGADRPAVRRLVQHEGYPVIVKRRRGRGGESFSLVTREEELEPAIEKMPDPVVQAFLDDQGGEFTVGVFSADGLVSSIPFRRRLGRTGSSWFAETVEDPEVEAYAEEIARASSLRGSANVQVRKSADGVRLLEVNARFSSLSPARAFAGFRDVEWSIELALGRVPSIPREGYRSIKFHRFVHEMIDDGAGYAPVPQWSRWSRPRVLSEPPEGWSAA